MSSFDVHVTIAIVNNKIELLLLINYSTLNRCYVQYQVNVDTNSSSESGSGDDSDEEQVHEPLGMAPVPPERRRRLLERRLGVYTSLRL